MTLWILDNVRNSKSRAIGISRASSQTRKGTSDQIETLQAARSINFINYVARIEDSPQEYINERCGELQEFVAKYWY